MFTCRSVIDQVLYQSKQKTIANTDWTQRKTLSILSGSQFKILIVENLFKKYTIFGNFVLTFN